MAVERDLAAIESLCLGLRLSVRELREELASEAAVSTVSAAASAVEPAAGPEIGPSGSVHRGVQAQQVTSQFVPHKGGKVYVVFTAGAG